MVFFRPILTCANTPNKFFAFLPHFFWIFSTSKHCLRIDNKSLTYSLNKRCIVQIQSYGFYIKADCVSLLFINIVGLICLIGSIHPTCFISHIILCFVSILTQHKHILAKPISASKNTFFIMSHIKILGILVVGSKNYKWFQFCY